MQTESKENCAPAPYEEADGYSPFKPRASPFKKMASPVPPPPPPPMGYSPMKSPLKNKAATARRRSTRQSAPQTSSNIRA